MVLKLTFLKNQRRLSATPPHGCSRATVSCASCRFLLWHPLLFCLLLACLSRCLSWNLGRRHLTLLNAPNSLPWSLYGLAPIWEVLILDTVTPSVCDTHSLRVRVPTFLSYLSDRNHPSHSLLSPTSSICSRSSRSCIYHISNNDRQRQRRKGARKGRCQEAQEGVAW